MSTPCEQSEKIDEIYNAIVGTLTSPGIRTMVAEMQSDMSNLKKTIYGNGKKGVLEIVNALQVQHEGEEKSWGKNIAMATLVLTNLIAIAGIVFQLYEKHP